MALGAVLISSTAGSLMAVGCGDLDSPPGPVPAALGQSQSALEVGGFDWGAELQASLAFAAYQLFGVKAPIGASAPASAGAVRVPFQPASDLLLLADGLTVDYLTREAGDAADMFSLWPNEGDPEYLVACIEGGREIIGVNGDGTDKYNPSVQRINLTTGRVDTVLRGMSRCDGIRTTPWGTVLATEETSDGGAYEILNPVKVTGATVLDRGATGQAATVDDDRVVKRIALMTMAWEGFTVLPSGVVIGGDELRPGSTLPDSDGGSIFKFVPASPRTQPGNIASLDLSPLVDGAAYAFQASCVGGRQQVGQGCEIGAGAWIPVGAATARDDADVQGATGYYRPEDLHLDPAYADADNPAAVRFCWANTGNSDAENWGEIVCAIDQNPLVADPETQTVIANRFIEGDTDMNAPDNLAFQPGTGNLYVIEDNSNGDIFACLKDGSDRDVKSDGCIKILSLTDSSAEPTGFTFSPDGKSAYLSVQHSRDDLMPLVDDYGTDDIVVISGFAID
jgi:hypothetical protein